MRRSAPTIVLDPATCSTLNGWVQAASTPQALALRSRIVLEAAAGRSNQQIASELQIPEVTVGKWRRSFALQALEGLNDAPRSGRPPKHDAEVWRKVQTLACQQPKSQGRWTVRTLARAVDLPASTRSPLKFLPQLCGSSDGYCKSGSHCEPTVSLPIRRQRALAGSARLLRDR